MRRLLLIPALALLLVGTPVLALEAPEPPSTTTTTIPLEPAAPGAPDTSTTTAPPTTAPTATTEPVTPAAPGFESAATPVEAELVGVKWKGDPNASFRIEVQSEDGTWSAAPEVEASDGPDQGTRDAAAAAQVPENTSEPVWIGDDAKAVRVVLEEGTATDVELAAVDAKPESAPGGAAGALADTFGTIEGPGRYVFGAVLFAVVAVLVALAFGWRPRWLRLRLLAVVAGALVLASCVPVAPPPPPPPPPSSGPPAANGPYPPTPMMYSRQAWGARPFQCAGGPEYAPQLQFAVVHHTVNSNSYGPHDGPAMVRAIQSYHMDVNGYCDIAYNFLIDRWGVIYIGRQGGIDKPVIGGHAGGFNTGSTGVALIGDFQVAQPSGEMWNSLVNLLRWRLSVAHIDAQVPTMYTVKSSPCGCQKWPAGTQIYMDNRIWGHGDLNATACPGGAFWTRRAELRHAVQLGLSFPQ